MSRNIFTYKGKATRLEFWLICLACIASLIVASPVIDSINDPAKTSIIVLYSLLMARVLSAVSSRCCHDLGLSGWGQFNPIDFLRIPFEDSAKT